MINFQTVLKHQFSCVIKTTNRKFIQPAFKLILNILKLDKQLVMNKYAIFSVQ